MQLSTDPMVVGCLDQDLTAQTCLSIAPFLLLPGHESTVQILSADPTTVVAPPELWCFLPDLEEFQILKGLDLCSSSLRALHLESRLRSQRRYSS
jgi:hypothetical protein